MTKEEARALGLKLVDEVKGYVARALEAPLQKLAALEQAVKEFPKMGPKGDPGEPGRVDPAELSTLVSSAVQAVFDVWPKPQDGKDGKDGLPGKDGPDEKMVREAITFEVEQRLDAFPKPKDGAQGPKGDPGAPGERGPAGEQGTPGKDGASVDLAMLKSQVGALVKDAVELLKPKDGADGKDGAPGPAGKDGQSIHPDTLARMVAERVEAAIAALPKARDGRDGMDAAQIEILSAIDPERGYPRGTFAEYAGGLVRAARATDPVRNSDPAFSALERCGWAVCMNGIADMAVSISEDGRKVSTRILSTNGRELVKDFSLPTMQYRGVWREGEYLRGDVATWDGSVWHAEADKPAGKPGESKDWKLMVKRGQNGRDADPGSPAAAPRPVRVK